jgi:hypothetical protein
MMVLMIAWGKRHFLQMDQLARRRAVKRLLGCPQRAMVSEIPRLIKKADEEERSHLQERGE